MKQIRRCVFETNSSSVHAITVCMKSDYDKWVNGEFYWDKYCENFVTKDVVESYDGSKSRFFSYERYCDEIEYEEFFEKFKTPNDEEVIAFGYYGNDY